MTRLRAARRFLLLRWHHLLAALIVAGAVYGGPIQRVTTVLGLLVMGFGAGVWVMACALVRDVNHLQRRAEHAENVNRRLVQGMRDRARRIHT